jgi:hypothetical protein
VNPRLRTISPIDGRCYVERELADVATMDAALDADYLDPALAWTGVKNSGRGCTLSRVGFEHLTRPKSFHFRITL